MSSFYECTVPLLWNANGLVEVIKDNDICPEEACRIIKLIEYFSSDENEGMYSPWSSSSNDVSDVDCHEKSLKSEDESSFNNGKCTSNNQPIVTTIKELSNKINAVEVESNLLKFQNTLISEVSHAATSQKDEKVHVCQVCGKCFSRKFNLNTHIKCVHSKEKDYLCKFCQRAFNHSSNLRKHIKTVHNDEKRIPCTFCTKSFKHNDALKNHLKFIHGWYKYDD